MNKLTALSFSCLIFLCMVSTAQGQLEPSYLKRLAIASDQKSVETQISVEITDTDVKRVILLEQKTYKPIGTVDVGPNKRNVYFKVKIEKDTSNNFLLLYEKQDGNPQQMPPIRIFGEGATAISSNVKDDSSDEDERTGKNPVEKPQGNKDSKIKIATSEIVTDESEYNLPLDVDKLDDSAKDFRVTLTSEVNGKKLTNIKQVTIKRKDKKIISPQELPLELKEGENTLEIVALNGEDEEIKQSKNKVEINCFKCGESSNSVSVNSLYARAIVGFQQTGASSANSSQKPFLNFFFTAPIFRDTEILEEKKMIDGKEITIKQNLYKFPKLSIWGDLRFSSIVQQQAASNIGLSSFSTSFLPTGDDGDLNDLVQSFEVLSGLEFKIWEPDRSTNLFGVRQKTMVSLIGAAGFSNPLTSQRSAQIFRVPEEDSADYETFIKTFPQAVGKENIAFIQGERDRFFRQYYGGLRFRTMHYDENNLPQNVSPAIFDVTVGQNEAITESLKGVILRLDGFYPFPTKKADYLYFFGSAQLKLGKRVDRNILPFILEPAGNVDIFEGNTAVVQINESPFLRSSRDRYSLGIGIDFIKLYKRLTAKDPKQ